MSETKKKTFREIILSWGVKILLALLILSFGVWGIGDYVSPQQNEAAVATIGETEISGYEFQNAYREQVARLQNLFGGNFTNEQAKAMGLGENVLQSLVQRNLFAQGAKSMGLLVSNDLVSREIRDDDRFKSPGGDFNRLAFNETIQRAGLNEASYIDLFRGSLLQNQFLSGITNGGGAPTSQADLMYRFRNEKRSANYIEIKHNAFNKIATPDDETLKKFHQDNAAQFTAPEYRAVTLVQMRIKDIVDEIDVPEEQIKAAYDDRINEFSTPERRKIQQILISDEAKAKEAHSKINAGEDFVKVAKEIANLDASALELGSLTRDQLPIKELADAAFSLAANTVSGPVKSPLGWHILRVSEVEAATQKSFATVRADLKKEIASEKAVDALYDLSNKFEDELGGGAGVAEAAKRLNFKSTKIAALSVAGLDKNGNKIADLDPTIIQAAFSTEQDQDSALTDLGNSGYFILHIDGVTPPALKPFETTKADIELAWKSEQQAIEADKKVKALMDRLKGAATLAQIAKELKVDVKTTTEFIRSGAGLKVQLPGPLVGGLFKANGKEAVSAASGDAHFIAQVKAVKQANPIADKKAFDELKNQLSGNITNDITAQLASALRAKLGVNINRTALEAAY